MLPDALEQDGKLQDAGGRPLRFIALVNERAGEVLQSGAPAFAQTIADYFLSAGVTCDVRLVPPDGLAGAIDAAIAEKPDAILVAGGDGTVNRLLPKLVAVPFPVGLLPLGTLNLLARDIELEGSLAQIAVRLRQLDVRPVDLGEVNGVLFHSNAGLGFFARMAREREGARRKLPSSKSLGFMLAALRAVWLHRPIAIELTTDGVTQTYKADALLVTNNQFEGSDWRRASLDGGLLEVHMLHATSLWGRIRAAAAVYRGTWRDLPHLQSLTAASIVVRRRGKLRSTIALDGELYKVRNPIAFASRPGAIKLICGRQAESLP